MANVADYNVANASGASVRADLNNILQAVVTLNSGTSAPSTMYPFMIWIDTNTNLVKMRNGANDAWLTMPFAMDASDTIPNSVSISGAVTASGLLTAAAATLSGDLTVDTSTLKVDSTNNRVGVGIATPAYQFHAYTTGYPVARFERNGGSAGSQGWTQIGHSGLGYSGGTGADSYFVAQHGFGFGVNEGTLSMVITDAGAVGIGTASPYASQKLTINTGTSDNALYCQSTDATVVMTFVDNGSTVGVQYGATGNNHIFRKDTAEKMRLDGSGRLLIGSETVVAHANMDDLQIGAGNSSVGINLYSGSSDYGTMAFGDGSGSNAYRGFVEYYHSEDSMRFGTSSLERMRIDSAGGVLIAKTSQFTPASKLVVSAGATGGTSPAISVQANTSTGSGSLVVWYNGGGSEVASIGMSNLNAGTSVSYNTGSDARWKDVTGEARGLEVINNLNPVAFNWKETGTADEGLIAQEVQEHMPNVVHEGNNGYLQMDYSKLVTPLIKAVQELSAEVEQLKQQAHEKCEN